jgi:hypothetical protein
MDHASEHRETGFGTGIVFVAVSCRPIPQFRQADRMVSLKRRMTTAVLRDTIKETPLVTDNFWELHIIKVIMRNY